MVKIGNRYIVTTTNGVYATPVFNVDEEHDEVTIVDSELGELSTKTISIGSIVRVLKEEYTQTDITDSFLNDAAQEIRVLASA